MKHLILAAFALAAASGAQAAPIQYDFSYTFADGESLFGSLIGELQGDGDTIAINSVTSVEYTEILSSDCCLPSPAPFFGQWDGTGVVSLSGVTMDFKSFPPGSGGQDAFSLSYAPFGPLPFGTLVFDSYFDITCISGCGEFVQAENFDAARWQITAVPLPAAAWLYVTGLALIGAWRAHKV